MDAFNFIVEEGLIMIPVLYILGEIIKNTETVANKWIPFYLLVFSICITPMVIGGYTADSFVQSVLVAGVTVFGNQLIKQNKKG